VASGRLSLATGRRCDCGTRTYTPAFCDARIGAIRVDPQKVQFDESVKDGPAGDFVNTTQPLHLVPSQPKSRHFQELCTQTFNSAMAHRIASMAAFSGRNVPEVGFDEP
jgi:hypothetical protein